MENIVLCENITKKYENGTAELFALNDISLSIEKGEFVAVMGASGSGKSSLMYSLSAMDKVSSGKIYFSGIDLMNLSDKDLSEIRRLKMGFIFQQATMLKNLNLLDNIILPAAYDNKKNKKDIVQRAIKLMKEMDIEGLEYRNISEVSGGQLQRANICRALMNNPEIIFADEPTGALNSKVSQEIMKIFIKINNTGKTILMVTHDTNVASKAERVLFMKDGKIISELSLGKYLNDDKSRVERVIFTMKKLGV